VPVSADEIEGHFRREYGRCVATLVRFFGDIDIAEEAVQEAFTIAVGRWPTAGLPPNPGAWITTTAKNRAIDHLRREASREDKHAQAALIYARDERGASHEDAEQEDAEHEEAGHENAGHETLGQVGPVQDDRLRLIFTCCHPALAPTAQVALTLRLLGGLQTPEIARAFLVPEATMAQRIVRAKRKIKAAAIPYRVSRDAELPERLDAVLSVVYLIFNEGYVASDGGVLVRDDLCAEAIRLARLLAELMPDEPEVLGPTRTACSGTVSSSPKASGWCGSACGATCLARTRSRPPSTPCTATPPTRLRLTGARFCGSMTSCLAASRPR
jgi:RNA polymerase sigma-70 factor, ECF subfamily